MAGFAPLDPPLEWIEFSSSHCVAVLDNLLTLIIGCEKGNGEITSLNQCTCLLTEKNYMIGPAYRIIIILIMVLHKTLSKLSRFVFASCIFIADYVMSSNSHGFLVEFVLKN